MVKVRELHRDRGARGVVKASDRLTQSRKQTASLANSASLSGRSRPLSGTGLVALLTRPPGAMTGTSPRSGLLEAHERAVAALVAERPAEARMQPAGVGRGLAARIGDLERHAERVVRQAVFDREREGEGIDGAGALVVARAPGGRSRARRPRPRRSRTGRSRAGRAHNDGRRPARRRASSRRPDRGSG